MNSSCTLRADVIVVGTGPGGATVARALARAGKRVLILERGLDQRTKPFYGTYLGAIRYCERGSLLFTQEGLNIIAPVMVGGATGMYTGCAARPPLWLKSRYGIDVDRQVDAAIEELAIAPLPAPLRGAASTRLAEAGRALGGDWFAQPKFMRPDRRRNAGHPFDCRATCMLGCRCGAKWNAAEWIDEAVVAGATLRTGCRVERVLSEDGHVVGVSGRSPWKPFRARAETVILAAGGLGSARILQRSGIADAGVGMAMDTTVMVYGFTRQNGTGNEPPMTWSYEDAEAGFMLSTLTDPWLLYPLIAVRKGIGPALHWSRWRHMLGLMIKLKDDITGGVFPDGKIRKPMTGDDNERLRTAESLCHRILLQAGARRETIFMTPFRGTHPSATVRIGRTVDSDLQTAIAGLFVCDASVFPESLDRPTVLTIIGLAKRLAEALTGNGNLS